MSQPKTIDRRRFLTSAASAWAAVTLGACGDDSNTGGTGGTAASETGGTTVGETGGVAGTGGTGGAAAGTGGVAAGTGGSSASGGDGGTGGMSGTGGGTYVCETNTSNGDHSHPLAVPGSDVERGFQEEPYLLEDGGTGHIHTLMISAYDFLYLQAGTMITIDSSTDSGHKHPCVIGCAQS